MSESLRSFLDLWHTSMLYGSIILLLAAAIVIIVYYVRYAGIKDLKDKYEFASLNEIKNHRLMHILIAIALGMFLNTLRPDLMTKGFVLFFVRLSIINNCCNDLRLCGEPGNEVLLPNKAVQET